MRNCTGTCVGKKLLNLTTCDKRLLNLTRCEIHVRFRKSCINN